MSPMERLLWRERFRVFPPPRLRQTRTDALMATLCMLVKAGSGLGDKGETVRASDFAPWVDWGGKPVGEGQDVAQGWGETHLAALRRGDTDGQTD